MARIVVTGGNGKAGRAVVRDLLEHGHEALSGAEVLPGTQAVVHWPPGRGLLLGYAPRFTWRDLL